MKTETLKRSFLLLLTALIWGAAFVAQSDGMNYVEPFTFNAVRNLIGGLVLIPCIFFLNRGAVKKEGSRANKKMLLSGGFFCGLALCAGSSLQQIGISMYSADTNVGKAGFLTALYIIMVPVFGIFMKKKVGLSLWASVAIALAGFYFLCMKSGFHVETADVIVLLGSAAFTVHILVIDYFSSRTDGVKMACIQFFVCGIISGILMLFLEKPVWNEILRAWLPILYAGVLSCGVGYTLQIIGQKNMNPTTASLILSLESVFSVLAAWLILGQRLGSREILGCVLVFLAIALAQIPVKTNRE